MHRYRRSLSLLLAVVLSAMLAACAKSPSTPQSSGTDAPAKAKSLRVAIFSEPGTLDFMQQGDMAATMVDWNLYDQLARYNYQTNKLEPELALSWEQESPTAWLVKLRQGVQFHKNYGEMTAEDVAFSVNYIIEKNARIKFLYAGVKDVQVVDKYTLRYNLTAPSTPFVMSSIQGFGGLVLSKKAFEELGPEKFARSPVGTGPFEFVDWVAGDHITLKKHDKYWDKGWPKVDTVNVRFTSDPAVKLNTLRAGEVDLIDNIPFKDMEGLKKDPNITVQTVPGWNWNYISFGDVTGPMAKKEVRQAVSYAIDRDAIIQNVYFGYARPAQKPMPTGFMFEDPSVTKYDSKANVAKAKELLAQAGYANGFEIPALAPDKDDVRREMQIVAEQLKAVGITLKLQFLDGAAYAGVSRKPGNFLDFNQITIMSPDPDSAINWFWHTGGSIARSYSNKDVDKLIDTSRTLVKPEERAPVYKELQQKMLDESFYIYVLHRNLARAMTKKVTGFQITPQDMDFNWKKVDIQG